MDWRQEQLRFGNYKFVRNKFYDTPDYEDLLPKIWELSKITAIGGVVLGAAHAYETVPHPVGHLERISKFGKVFMPVMGATVVFNLTSYFIAKMRMKNDCVNNTWGGAAAGAFLGLVARCPIRAGLAMGLLSLAAYSKKKAVLNNEALFIPEFPARGEYSSYVMRNLDFSLTPDDKKRTWSRELPPE